MHEGLYISTYYFRREGRVALRCIGVFAGCFTFNTMTYRPFVIAFEAILLGGPITFISFFLVFTVIPPFITPLDWELMKLSMLSVGTWFALSEYWRLAYATVIGKRHKFGLLFWAAISGAAGGTYLSYELLLFNYPAMLLFLGSIIFATSHFIFLQLKCINTLSPPRH